MSFVKGTPPDREGRPTDWLIGQSRGGKFFATKGFSEIYDPEKVLGGAYDAFPTESPRDLFDQGFPEERAKELVLRLNKRSPLTKVTMVDGRMIQIAKRGRLNEAR
jgi:hypothetical protein